ncbi:MAG TPA: VCBS repeat-containing protein [Terriglobales bacterium]|nr:VCBS repeat-containing protein [Terriglobales bacterium]
MRRSPKSLLLLLPIAMMTLLTCSSQQQPEAQNRPLFHPAPGSPLAAGAQVGNVALADVDGNGWADIVFASQDGLGLLLADGRGGFQPARLQQLKPAPHLVAATDFTADGDIDIAASNHDSNSVSVLLGDGRGEFRAAPHSPFVAFAKGKPHNHGLFARDVNGDGAPDITFGHQETGLIAVLLNDGKGRFKPAAGSPFQLGRGFYPHKVVDLDGDGKMDIVAPDLLGNAVVIARGDGKGGFTVAQTIPVRERPYFVVVADFDHNGHNDIIVMHDDISEVAVLLSDSEGRFSKTEWLDVGERPAHAVATDFDRDGNLDIAFATGHGAYVFLGDGKGGFRLNANYRGGQWDIATADLNRDGKMDLVLPDFEQGTISVLLGQ